MPTIYRATIEMFTSSTGTAMCFQQRRHFAWVARTISAGAAVPTLDINVKGVLNGVHCIAAVLRTTPGARILTMCSTGPMACLN